MLLQLHVLKKKKKKEENRVLVKVGRYSSKVEVHNMLRHHMTLPRVLAQLQNAKLRWESERKKLVFFIQTSNDQ